MELWWKRFNWSNFFVFIRFQKQTRACPRYLLRFIHENTGFPLLFTYFVFSKFLFLILFQNKHSVI